MSAPDALREVRYWPRPVHRWDGSGCEHGEGVLVKITSRNGYENAKVACRRCGNVGGAIPRRLLSELGLSVTDMPTYRDHIDPDMRCQHADCERSDVELHHWAPRAVFGMAGADDWPVSPLCPDHHRMWHRAMTGSNR